MNNISKKFLCIGISVMIVFVTITGIMQMPFVAAAYILEHPISVVADFLSSAFGYDGDTNDKTIYDMAYIYYSQKENKKVFDEVLKKYDANGLTETNLAIPFLIFEYKTVNKNDADVIAKWLAENAKDELDELDYIEFLSKTEVFAEKRKLLNYDISAIGNFFGVTDISATNDIYDYIAGNSEKGNAIAEAALKKLGARYWWGANGPTYFDCSGLVYYACNQAGIKIGRTTAAGYSRSGKAVSYEHLEVGDVITFDYGSGVAHIGIYIGNQKMVNALGSGSSTVGQYASQCVKINSIAPNSYFYKRIYNCRRLY